MHINYVLFCVKRDEKKFRLALANFEKYHWEFANPRRKNLTSRFKQDVTEIFLIRDVNKFRHVLVKYVLFCLKRDVKLFRLALDNLKNSEIRKFS